MPPTPLYDAKSATPAYGLRYSWTGWPSSGRLPSLDAGELLRTISPLWESDGLRLLEFNWPPDRVQLTFSTQPNVSPVQVAARAKGRLQYALRQAGTPCEFSRKVSVRAVGNNTRRDVEQYIRTQVDREPLADPDYAASLRDFTVTNPDVDLSRPTASARGRYWYNLHIVLVTAERLRCHDRTKLARIRDGCQLIAVKKGYGISELAVMPDHLHVALRCDIEQSPEEIALTFKNNLAYVLGQVRWWSEGYYAGTFGEYDMGAVRT